MRKEKFIVTFYSTSEAYLRKSLVDAGFIPDKIEKATKTNKQKLAAFLDTVLSENEGFTNEEIASIVLKQRKIDGSVMLDDVVLTKGKTKATTSHIYVVESFEFCLSVDKACELAGI